MSVSKTLRKRYEGLTLSGVFLSFHAGCSWERASGFELAYPGTAPPQVDEDEAARNARTARCEAPLVRPSASLLRERHRERSSGQSV